MGQELTTNNSLSFLSLIVKNVLEKLAKISLLSKIKQRQRDIVEQIAKFFNCILPVYPIDTLAGQIEAFVITQEEKQSAILGTIAGIVAKIQSRFLVKAVGKLIEQIRDLRRDQGEGLIIRNFCSFINKVSKENPLFIYNNFSTFVDFLSFDQYLMRKEAIRFFSTQIRTTLCETWIDEETFFFQTKESEDQEKLRQTSVLLLNFIFERLEDSVFNVRKEALKQISKLIETNKLPQSYYLLALSMIINRMQDQNQSIKIYSLAVFQQLVILLSQLYPFQKDKSWKEQTQNISNQIEKAKSKFSYLQEIEAQLKQEEEKMMNEVKRSLPHQDRTEQKILLKFKQHPDYNPLVQKAKENSNHLDTLNMIFKYNSQKLHFMQMLELGIQLITYYMVSKADKEIVQAVQSLQVLKNCDISIVDHAVKQTVHLMTTQFDQKTESIIHGEVAELYFESFFKGVKEKEQADFLIEKCLEIQNNPQEQQGFELLISKIVENYGSNGIFMRGSFFKQIFSYFDTFEEDLARAKQALKILRVLAQTESRKNRIEKHQHRILEFCAKALQSQLQDMELVEEALKLLKEMIKAKDLVFSAQILATDINKGMQQSEQTMIFLIMEKVVQFSLLDNKNWYSLTQELLRFFYEVKKISSQEYIRFFMALLIRNMKEVKKDEESIGKLVARIFFVLGETAIHSLCFLKQIENDIKSLESQNQLARIVPGGGQNQEIDQVQGGNQRIIQSYEKKLKQILENSVSEQEQPQNLIGHFIPLIVEFFDLIYCKSLEKKKMTQASELEKMTVMAICKFFSCSEKLALSKVNQRKCQLDMALELMVNRNVDSNLRVSILMCVGNLYQVNQNLIDIDSRRAKMTQLLKDDDSFVKLNSLNIITHLILAGRLKCREEFFHIVLMAVDEHEQVKAYAKMFLKEQKFQGQQEIFQNIVLCNQKLAQHSDDLGKEKTQEIIEEVLTTIEKEEDHMGLVESLIKTLGKNQGTQFELKEKYFASLMLRNLKMNRKIFSHFLRQFDRYKLCFRKETDFQDMEVEDDDQETQIHEQIRKNLEDMVLDAKRRLRGMSVDLKNFCDQFIKLLDYKYDQLREVNGEDEFKIKIERKRGRQQMEA